MLKNKGYKGITLISLIVTIIVLLILAGVTISQITGSENAMEKATEAREKNEQGAELEQIKLAVVNTITKGLNGLVDADTLKGELNGLIDETSRSAITNAKTSWIVTANSGLKYKIKQNGEVTSAEPVETIEFTETETTIKIGKSKALSLSIKGKSGNETEANKIEYSFSVENIAEVLDNGQIKIKDNVDPDTKVIVTAIADGVTSSNSCEITSKEDIWELGVAINSTNYGKKITNYKSNIETNQDDIGWRLFFQDNEYTYIIADIPIESYKLEDEYDAYTNGSYVNSIGKGLNSIYYINYPTKFTLSNTNINIRAVAWLTDTSRWIQYTDSNSNNKASWAIACPTIELLIKSFNSDAENDSETPLIIPTVNQNGYNNLWGGGSGQIPVDYNNGIYNYSTDVEWWIATPYYYDYNSSKGCLYLQSNYSRIGNGSNSSTRPIRPIVCIPTTDFNNTYTLESN